MCVCMCMCEREMRKRRNMMPCGFTVKNERFWAKWWVDLSPPVGLALHAAINMDSILPINSYIDD